MTKKIDVIIFGASGFTGKYAVLEAVSVLKNLEWGIAGRSRPKLEGVLQEMGTKANKNLMNTSITIADVKNESSLLEMANRCRVLVNCCGPYRFFGEPVVRACIEAGTHHVDVSGEDYFIEKMQLKYHKQAQERGVYIISACGFDSIPADMGVIYAEQNFDGVVNSVESYLKTYKKGKGRGGVHYGTWESAIHAIANSNDLKDIRSKLYPKKLPKFEPVVKQHPLLHYSDVSKGYCLPFIGPDLSVVKRSQRFLYENEKKRPVQMLPYISLKSRFAGAIVTFFVATFITMTKISFFRNLLLKYPKFFTFGFFSHDGPSEEGMQNTFFSHTMKAVGWPKSDTLAEPTDKYSVPPTKTLVVKVSGSNPGYGATCVALLTSALTILKENEKMPGSGGVLPPGAAFAKTNLINELQKHDHGLKFEIVSRK